MKVGKTKLMTLLLFLCCAKFFISGSYIRGIYYLDIICFMLFGWFFLNIMVRKLVIPVGKIGKSTFFYPILAFWGMTIAEIIYSYVRYQQPLTSVIKMSYFHLVLVVYFALVILLDSKEKLDTFKSMLILFCTLCNVFQIIHYVLYSTSWNPYFYLTMLSFPFVMTNFFIGKNKKQALINLLTTIVCVFFVGHNTAIRIAFIVVMLAVVLTYIITNVKRRENELLIRGIVFFVAGVCVLGGFVGTYIKKIIDSGVGNQIRIYAMEYYWDKFLQSPIFGMGFIDPNTSEKFYELVHGEVSPLGGINQYYIEDVGVVGYITQFGLIGSIVLVWILIKIYKLVKSCKGNLLIEGVGMLSLLLVMFLSLMPTNKAPIQMFPILMMIMEKNAEVSMKTDSD